MPEEERQPSVTGELPGEPAAGESVDIDQAAAEPAVLSPLPAETIGAIPDQEGDLKQAENTSPDQGGDLAQVAGDSILAEKDSSTPLSADSADTSPLTGEDNAGQVLEEAAGSAEAPGSDTNQIPGSDAQAVEPVTEKEPLKEWINSPDGVAGGEKNGFRQIWQALLLKARLAIQKRKSRKRDKILAETVKRGSISNDEVEKLLHVSHATATRYLKKLVSEGQLVAEGRGRKIIYRRK